MRLKVGSDNGPEIGNYLVLSIVQSSSLVGCSLGMGEVVGSNPTRSIKVPPAPVFESLDSDFIFYTTFDIYQFSNITTNLNPVPGTYRDPIL